MVLVFALILTTDGSLGLGFCSSADLGLGLNCWYHSRSSVQILFLSRLLILVLSCLENVMKVDVFLFVSVKLPIKDWWYKCIAHKSVQLSHMPHIFVEHKLYCIWRRRRAENVKKLETTLNLGNDATLSKYSQHNVINTFTTKYLM